MTIGTKAPAAPVALSFDFELDAPPAKVWRALTVPEFVAKWLTARIDGEPAPSDPREGPSSRPAPVSLRLLTAEPGRSVRYLWREEEGSLPPSIVTFRITPSGSGGTRFRVVHETSGRVLTQRRPANHNAPRLLLAA